VARIDADYQKRKEMVEFNLQREERLKAAEEKNNEETSETSKEEGTHKETKKIKLDTIWSDLDKLRAL
jgi:hypothetical protein